MRCVELAQLGFLLRGRLLPGRVRRAARRQRDDASGDQRATDAAEPAAARTVAGPGRAAAGWRSGMDRCDSSELRTRRKTAQV